MNKAEKDWMERVQALGCIACREEMDVYTPAEIHHILRSGRRIDHFHVLPLCAIHHRGGRNDATATSRHPYRLAFEERYGAEWDLLALVRARLGGTRQMHVRTQPLLQTSC